MLEITFHPDSDSPQILKATEEYQKIWRENGKRFQEVIERISGFKFEIDLDATVFEGVSEAFPLRLRASYEYHIKQSILIHELCHIVYRGDQLKLNSIHESNPAKDGHKFLDLILYDIWSELFEQGEVQKFIEFEKSLTNNYKVAWEWALKFNKTERQKLYQEILKTGIVPE